MVGSFDCVSPPPPPVLFTFGLFDVGVAVVACAIHPSSRSKPAETAWRVVRVQDGVTLLAGLAAGSSLTSYCAPRGSQLRLDVHDSGKDGLSAGASVSLAAFGSVVVSASGSFGSLSSLAFGFGGPQILGSGNTSATFVGRVDIPAGAAATYRCSRGLL
jgi:hypothetical protein